MLLQMLYRFDYTGERANRVHAQYVKCQKHIIQQKQYFYHAILSVQTCIFLLPIWFVHNETVQHLNGIDKEANYEMHW